MRPTARIRRPTPSEARSRAERLGYAIPCPDPTCRAPAGEPCREYGEWYWAAGELVRDWIPTHIWVHEARLGGAAVAEPAEQAGLPL